LIVSDGRRQRELLIVSKIVVGRDPTCDLSEADPLLSRRHAEFSVAGEDTVVRDLGSRNGIYINGARTAEGTLQSGDVVRIGRLHMRYIEDAAPLVSAPELVDDATGLVFPGPRPGAAQPPAAPPRGAAASGAIPKPAVVSSAFPKPASTPGSKLRPVPAAPDEGDADVTSYVSPSAIRKQSASAAGSAVRSQTPQAAAPNAPPPGDEAESTRVVPAPGRSGLRPPAPPMVTAVLPPPVPIKEDELTSYVALRPRSSVQPPPPADHTSVVPPPAPPMAHKAVDQTAFQPPPLPPAEDMDEPTSVILMPRAAKGAVAAVDAALNDRTRQARALAMAVDAIAAFLGRSSKGQPAADAVKALERDLASAAPPAELVDALKGLAARVSAAANELT